MLLNLLYYFASFIDVCLISVGMERNNSLENSKRVKVSRKAEFTPRIFNELNIECLNIHFEFPTEYGNNYHNVFLVTPLLVPWSLIN